MAIVFLTASTRANDGPAGTRDHRRYSGPPAREQRLDAAVTAMRTPASRLRASASSATNRDSDALHPEAILTWRITPLIYFFSPSSAFARCLHVCLAHGRRSVRMTPAP